MKYIKKYENGTAYNNANLILPNVSLISSDSSIRLTPDTNTVNKYDYVEIGGIKWATKNLGASKIQDAGLFFQWGDTVGYTKQQLLNNVHELDETHYKYYQEGYEKYNGYPNGPEGGYVMANEGCITSKYNLYDEKIKLDLIDDPVHTALGGNWRMPSLSEYLNLFNATNHVWVDGYKGTNMSGTLLIDKFDGAKQLFFPALGHMNYQDANKMAEDTPGEYVMYWASDLYAACTVDYFPCGYGFYIYKWALDDMNSRVNSSGIEASDISTYTGVNDAMSVRGILDDNLNNN